MMERMKISWSMLLEAIDAYIHGNKPWAKFAWFICRETFLGHCEKVDEGNKERTN